MFTITVLGGGSGEHIPTIAMRTLISQNNFGSNRRQKESRIIPECDLQEYFSCSIAVKAHPQTLLDYNREKKIKIL